MLLRGCFEIVLLAGLSDCIAGGLLVLQHASMPRQRLRSIGTLAVMNATKTMIWLVSRCMP